MKKDRTGRESFFIPADILGATSKASDALITLDAQPGHGCPAGTTCPVCGPTRKARELLREAFWHASQEFGPPSHEKFRASLPPDERAALESFDAKRGKR